MNLARQVFYAVFFHCTKYNLSPLHLDSFNHSSILVIVATQVYSALFCNASLL